MVNFDYLFDKSMFEDEISVPHRDNKKMSVSSYPDAIVLPCKELDNGKSGGGVIDKEGVYIQESCIHYDSHVPYEINIESIETINEPVIYFGMLIGVWGHCIADCIKRAWFFNSDEYKNKYKNIKVVYVSHPGSLHENFIALLSMLNINIESFVEVKKPTRFAEIIMPDSCFFLDENRVDHFTEEYIRCIDKVKSKYIKQKQEINKKVYYSHRNVRGFNNDIGEEKIERFFEANGFEIVHPEQLSLGEQLDLLSRCSVFAATDGSSSHNSIFLPEDSEVIIIPRSPYLTFHQLALNELYDQQRIYYIDSSLSILCKGNRPTRGPFFYFVSENLIEHVEHRKPIIDKDYLICNFSDFKKYLKQGFYVEDDRSFTAYSPYTEIAFYYFNKFLYQRKLQCCFVHWKRNLTITFIKVQRKLKVIFRK